MTSIRNRLEEGNIDEHMRRFVVKNAGSTPLCCNVIYDHRQLTCDRITEPVSWKEFREKCIQCQAEMLYKLGGL